MTQKQKFIWIRMQFVVVHMIKAGQKPGSVCLLLCGTTWKSARDQFSILEVLVNNKARQNIFAPGPWKGSSSHVQETENVSKQNIKKK